MQSSAEALPAESTAAGDATSPNLKPRTATDWMEQADKERRLGHHETALLYYGRALENDRSLVNCWVGQVQMLLYLDEPRQAQTWSTSGLKLYPGNGDLFACQALALLRLGDFHAAMERSDAACNAPGDSAWRWLVRAEVLLARRSRNVEHCYQMATSINPDWLVKLEVALMQLRHNKAFWALKNLAQATQQSPDSSFAWFLLAICQRQLRNRSAALDAVSHALAVLPDFQEAKKLQRELQTSGGLLSWLARLFFLRR